MQIKLGIDISAVQYDRGISRYTANLVRALATHKREITLRLIGSSFRRQSQLRAFAKDAAPHALAKIFPHPVKVMEVLWNRLHVFSPELVLGDLDVFHSWEQQPPLRNAALVTTIHDLAMLKFPKTADPYVLSMNQESWKRVRKEATQIIAVSEATKRDIVELLKIRPNKVTVVYEALPEESRLLLTAEKRRRLLRQFGLNAPFLLFVGTLEPRKNLSRLIEAWRPLKRDVDLVIAGQSGWQSLSSEQGLHLVGKVSHEHLAALYGESKAFVFPSLYEGFGLPILEAFYHKTPVVTSKSSGMEEVAGKAARLVEPMHVESIREGIEDVLNNRESFVSRGKARLRSFSWKKVATETIDVYKRAVELRS